MSLLDNLSAHWRLNEASGTREDAHGASDLDDNKVRTLGLELGFVDVKVAAIDETWSGLKFVRRLADRG